MIKLTRRNTLVFIISGIATTIFFRKLGIKFTSRNEVVSLHRIMTNLVNVSFENPKKTKQFGTVYLRTFPNEADAHILVKLLLNNNPELARKAVINDLSQLNLLLQQQIKNDFELDKTVNICGWIMALTEARLSALSKFV